MKRIIILGAILAIILAYMAAVWYFVPDEKHDVSFSERSEVVALFKHATFRSILKVIYKPALIAITLGAMLAFIMAFIKKLPSWARLAIQVIIPAAAVFRYDVFVIKKMFPIPRLDYASHTLVLRADNAQDLYLKYLQITAFDVLFAVAGALAVAIICEAVLVAIKKK